MFEIFAVIGCTCTVLAVAWCIVKVVHFFQRVKEAECKIDRLFETKNDFICRFQRIENRVGDIEKEQKNREGGKE